MESQLIVEGIGPWKSFDDIEEHLVLDELLLLHDSLNKKKHHYFRMMGSFQGVDIGDLGDDDESSEGLPEEIAAMEAEFRRRKEAHLNAKPESAEEPPKAIAEINGALGGGFGYKKV